MLAPRVRRMVRRIIVDHLDICNQSCARIRAFDQVMRQQRIARKSPVQHLVQCRHVVDALAGEDPLPEQVLVYIRDRPRIDVEACLP